MAGSPIPTGYPSPAQDYSSGETNLSDYLIHDKTSTFIVRVCGHSMQEAGVSDGDELIVNSARTPVDGSIVVAILDGEMTVKRLRLTPQGVVLQTENPECLNIVMGEWGVLSVWAVAETCIHR